MRTPVLPYIGVELWRPSIGWAYLNVDLLGCTFTRGNTPEALLDDLTIGIANVTVKGAAWSPASNPDVRQGSMIRIVGLNPAGTWVPLWQGTMRTPTSTYHPDGTVVTSFSAIDSFGYAADQKPLSSMTTGTLNLRVGYAQQTRTGASDLSRTLVGSDDTSAGSFAPYFDENHSILDQFTLIRNSTRAWLWSGRGSERQVMMRSTASPPPTSPVLTFSDRKTDAGSTVHYYTDLDLTHDAESFATAITFRLVVDGGGYTAGDYGPFRDQTALDAGWPRKDVTVEITDMFSGASSYVAREYLRERPIPTVSAKAVSIDVLRNRNVLTNDLIYQPVRIKNTPAGHNSVYHIVSEEHAITPDSWKATYRLKTLTAARFPTIETDA